MRNGRLLLVLGFLCNGLLSEALSADAEGTEKAIKDRFVRARLEMIKTQFREDIKNPSVLEAFRSIPRENFVLPAWKGMAYHDNPLPIGEGQTISQPYVVALMTQAIDIKEGQKVLEIGTGSGYQAAILRHITNDVYSIEIRKKLTLFAKHNLKTSGISDVHLKTADGYFGWEENGPYDAIVVTCAVNHVPPPLKKQLKIGGRLILPLGSTTYYQTLILITRESEKRFRKKTLIDVRFVPMTGKAQEQDQERAEEKQRQPADKKELLK